ncbi:hypothetical protein ACHQM5_010084 [Ranunculus cassubicifolius]
MIGGSNREKDLPARGGAARYLATTFSGKSMSTSGGGGSIGSPSSRNQAEKIHLEDGTADPQSSGIGKKKKRGQRAVGGDKSMGLRQFSMKVCEKVESKGRTTHNEVADELVAEFCESSSNVLSSDEQQYDEKNIRRRVYDALNVLMAIDIISKDKKEIQWRGFPRTTLDDIEELKAEHVGLRNRVEKKSVYLQELEEQLVGLQNLVQRNEQLYGSGNAPTGGVALPFILVQTRPHATVEVEISEDMQLVHFDFNSTPFELHDDNHVLKEMRFSQRDKDDRAETDTPQQPAGSRLSPPLPGILKSRLKPEDSIVFI